MTPKPQTRSELEALTYAQPNINDHTLENNNLARNCPLDNGRHHIDPKFTLGSLDLLPPELLSAVLLQIDLQSLTNFRRVNQRAMGFVDSIPQYHAVVKYASDSLRGILSIGSGPWISCQDLYDKLCTAQCEDCTDFGGYLYILTCKRVCFRCLSDQPKYLPLLRRQAMVKFGLDSKSIANLLQMRSKPGSYSPSAKICRTSLTLIDYESARYAGIALRGTVAAMEAYVNNRRSEELMDYMTRQSEWLKKQSGSRPRFFRNAFDGKSGNPLRFMAIVPTPHLDACAGVAEWGFHCLGCQKEKRGPILHWRRKFSMDTFRDHLKECGGIVDGTHRSPST